MDTLPSIEELRREIGEQLASMDVQALTDLKAELDSITHDIQKRYGEAGS